MPQQFIIWQPIITEMKLSKILIVLIIFVAVSCDEPSIEKPENLIKKDQMIEMMADIHLAEATFTNRRYSDTLVKNSSQTNFYYSILEKYHVPDSVFEKSFVYYASFPKDFEKLYRQVMNKLNETEQEFSGRKNDLLDLGIQE